MISTRIKFPIVFSLIAFLLFTSSNPPELKESVNQECFMVLVGKKASQTGRVLLAHNNDLTGKEVSFVELIPPIYETGQKKINYSNGSSITLLSRTYRVLIQRIEAGFDEGDAVAINEFGVAIAGGVALGQDRNKNAESYAPLVPKGLPGGVRYDILARSKTAKECVKMLGKAYTEYGVSYPSGVGIADSSEIWYIECGGGKQWAAVRVPDNCYWVQANGYRIGEIDTSNKDFCLTSPGLLDYCANNELWDPDEGPFNFTKVFGGGRTEKNGGLRYDRLRVWRGINLLTPSLGLGIDDELPTYLIPDKLISESGLFALLRDYYAETEFDKSNHDLKDESIRSIACWKGVHSSLIVLSPSKLIESSTILWSGIGSPLITGFTPIPFGVSKLPSSYTVGSEELVFNIFHKLAEKCSKNWEIVKSVQSSFKVNEINLIKVTNDMMEEATRKKIDKDKLNLFAENAARTVRDILNAWLAK